VRGNASGFRQVQLIEGNLHFQLQGRLHEDVQLMHEERQDFNGRRGLPEKP
jgi:hypothetical protein